MNINLENWLRNKLQENEEMHDYAVATDTVRCWIEDYNQLCQSEESILSLKEEKHLKTRTLTRDECLQLDNK